MKNYIKHLFALALCASFFCAPVSHAQEVSREEFLALSKKVEALQASIDALLSSGAVNNRDSSIEALASEALASMPTKKAEKSALIADVVDAIQTREESVNFPWMEEEKWSSLKRGMSPEQVIEVLGKPYTDEPSLHKRKDRVFTWVGKRVATGKKVEGIVRFYKGGLVEIEYPEL